ncbi:MAG: ATP-dependent 6-phosphofructokinase [Phycisphaerae bacterium]|nr:ATP-dependent 6-phosphofructokinase [Phycisphaerae bacterium]
MITPHLLTPDDLNIKTLGPCKVDSPLASSVSPSGSGSDHFIHAAEFVQDSHRVLLEDRLDRIVKKSHDTLPAFELAGPRRKIFFDPHKLRVGIVTCGGICPGLNDVIRGIVMELHYRYGVKSVLGFRYGYEGFLPQYGHDVMELTPQNVKNIHETGGTILGTSRGDQSKPEIVDCLERMNVNILFAIGGDGTQRGAKQISEEVERRGEKIAVVGIPKTIDNDLMYIDKSFGFETAVHVAFHAVQCAHTEAESCINGIGLVKLMGRDSGWIACHTALASSQANFVLIPESPFQLHGTKGFLPCLLQRLRHRRHACIIVSEGAGQDLISGDGLGNDASGNVKYKDIGLFLKQQIKDYLDAEGMKHTIKYIDPSYMIRSVPATPNDSLYCLRLAQAAVHAAMTGRTEMVVGRWREQFVHVPTPLSTCGRKTVDPEGDLWLSVLENTGQPMVFE